METKYTQLKNLIKERAEFQRTLKEHRKTERFKGERLTNVKWYTRKYTNGKWQDVEVIIPELDPYTASRILDGCGSYVCSTARINNLYTIYGILRNERKTKKIKQWEDIVNSEWYENSNLKDEVDDWRDDYQADTVEEPVQETIVEPVKSEPEVKEGKFKKLFKIWKKD